ncbi:putative DNA repair protein XRCC4 [Helianthus annuus]|nr:putative DNA repair protein XRCC4 [Helianthus annuus]
MNTPKHTCLKLQIPQHPQPIFIKGTWFSSHFNLSITDGSNAWSCTGNNHYFNSITISYRSFKTLTPSISILIDFFAASEDEVAERASNWDQPVSEYVEMSERYLGFQQPGSVYGFADAGGGFKRVGTFLFLSSVVKIGISNRSKLVRIFEVLEKLYISNPFNRY